MKRIYLDNGSTSFPKAPGLGRRIMEYVEEGVVNPNRTESGLSYSAFSVSYSLREKLSKLYHHPYPESIAFTRNVTEALNWIIKGLFTSSDHVIVSSNEHNAVMRPLVQNGIPFSRIPSWQSEGCHCPSASTCPGDSPASYAQPHSKTPGND